MLLPLTGLTMVGCWDGNCTAEGGHFPATISFDPPISDPGTYEFQVTANGTTDTCQGQLWTPPQTLLEFGVWPCVQLLDCGVLVLSYGRPGVHLRFAADGVGQAWSDPLTLIEGRADDITRHTCGYTSLLPLDTTSFLVAYSDFLHRDAGGRTRKAILVRRVQVGV